MNHLNILEAVRKWFDKLTILSPSKEWSQLNKRTVVPERPV
jgi:hypothetical protein